MLSARIVVAGSLESSLPTNLAVAKKQRLPAFKYSIESKVLQTLATTRNVMDSMRL